ncbi:MAG: hypothetical protein J6T63_08520 [Bacteroidales bacterium]|nr:hypothetical protein [Bacteroidales bacterium]
MEKFERLNYQVLSDAFVHNGWKRHHLFMIGDSWVKGDDKIACLHSGYILNGNLISSEQVIKMLDIDVRLLQVADALDSRNINTKYSRAFIDGVAWADEHPCAERLRTRVEDMAVDAKGLRHRCETAVLNVGNGKNSPFPSGMYNVTMRSGDNAGICLHLVNNNDGWEAVLSLEGKVLELEDNGRDISVADIEAQCKLWLSQENKYGINNRVAALSMWDSLHAEIGNV